MVEFRVGDKAVYPAQGVAEIVGIDEKEISGKIHRFYVRRSDSYWALVFYLWATTLSYQAFRGTTFVLLVLFMFRFLPVMVGVKLLATGLNRGVRLARPAWVSGPA